MRYLLFLFILVGCISEDPKPKPKPKPSKPLEFRWKNKSYDKQMISSIEKVRKPIRAVRVDHSLVEMKPSDWKEFINEWPSTREGVISFWGKILVEMSWWESGWKTNTKYKEKFGVKSRGLFQMSIQSSNSYGCGWKKDQEIHDNPLKAIDCAVATLAYWVKRDGCLACKGKKDPNNRWDSGYRGGGRYWAVFRGNRDYTVKSLRAIKGVNK